MKKISLQSTKKKIYFSLKKTFKKTKIPKNIDKLKIGSNKEWDSLGNYNLLLELEKNFSVRFSSSEMIKITSIESIINYLKKKKII